MITAHGNTGWESETSQVTNWTPWQYAEEEIKEAERKKKKLPEIDVGSMLYQPTWSETLRFYIPIKRQSVEQQGLFEPEGFKREKKIHLDLRYFPCQKLRANFACGFQRPADPTGDHVFGAPK